MFCPGNPGKLPRGVVLLTALFAAVMVLGQENQPLRGVVDLSGRPVDPFHRTSGKVVVLVFVRTDCPIVNRYAPTIQEISRKYKDAATFYLVYPVRTETPAQINRHLKEYGYALGALRDPNYELVKRAQTRVTPEAAVFSTDGKLLYHGRINDWYAEFGRARREPTTQELVDALNAATAGKPAANAEMPAVGCFLPDRP